MKISKATAIFLSVVFFIIVSSVIAIFIGSLFPGFSFSNNLIVRIIFLVVTFIIARKFYDYIYTDVKVKEGKNDVAVYSDDLDKKRKIAVGLVTIILIMSIVYISVSVLFFSGNDNGNSNELVVLNFNNSDISFNYSSDWSIESNNSTDIVLLDNYGDYLYISNDKTGGYTLKELYNIYGSRWEKDENISIVNSSNIEISDVPAIESYLNISSNKTINMSEDFSLINYIFNIKPNRSQYINSYEVIMVKGDRYYSITYYYTGNIINDEEFKIFINSLKIS